MNNEQVEQIDILELVRGIFKGALQMMMPGLLLVVLLTGYFCFRTWRYYTPTYQASASFTVKVVNPLYANQSYYNNSAAEQMADTFPHIITSGLLTDRVKERIGISYMPSVTARSVGNTNIFTLTVTASDPELAYDVLKCVIEFYPSVAEFVIGPTRLTPISESGVPEKPVSRLSLRSSAIRGVTMGVVLWGAMAFLYWMMHKTVTNKDELTKVVNLTCLGQLPRVPGTLKNGSPIVSDKNDKFGFNESVRLLRVRVEKTMTKEKGNVLMVTSSIPNEGKTTVSINLATALALKGKKTLLVDCDLRNPSVGEVYGVEIEHGFSDFLEGKCTVENIFYRMPTDNLYTVFGKNSVGDPGILLTNEKANAFLSAARRSFDYIILDTPPCAMMADATEICALADGVILAVRQDFASRRQIQEGVQMLGDSEKPIIGTVLNMTTPHLGQSSYHSYYGYGYGYGAYGSHGENGKKKEE